MAVDYAKELVRLYFELFFVGSLDIYDQLLHL